MPDDLPAEPDRLNEPLPAPNDPGDALRKGYVADPQPEPEVPPQDPIPLAPGPDRHPGVRLPDPRTGAKSS